MVYDASNESTKVILREDPTVAIHNVVEGAEVTAGEKQDPSLRRTDSVYMTPEFISSKEGQTTRFRTLRAQTRTVYCTTSPEDHAWRQSGHAVET